MVIYDHWLYVTRKVNSGESRNMCDAISEGFCVSAVAGIREGSSWSRFDNTQFSHTGTQCAAIKSQEFRCAFFPAHFPL